MNARHNAVTLTIPALGSGRGQVSGHMQAACHHSGLPPEWAQRKGARGEEVLSYNVSVLEGGVLAVSPVC